MLKISNQASTHPLKPFPSHAYLLKTTIDPSVGGSPSGQNIHHGPLNTFLCF
jgi:hypothetical protein